MNRDDVVRMARETGLCDEEGKDSDSIVITDYLERFAALVVAAEREACAQACENDDWRVAASVVRARGARPAPEPTEHNWQGLSTAETKALWAAAEKKPSAYAAMIEAKLKEKNT